LSDNLPNAKDVKTINDLFKEINTQIDNISMISKTTTNSKPSTLPKAETQPTNKFDTISVNINTPNGVKEVNLQFIMQQLGIKIEQIGNNKNAAEKYVNLKNTLQNAVRLGSSSDDIQNMINRSGIVFSTDGKMKGGINKTKKTIKKGGFLYNKGSYKSSRKHSSSSSSKTSKSSSSRKNRFFKARGRKSKKK
jgi:hypothetical protein